MTMRNIILFYVQHHPGCEVKNVAADIDFAYQTIGTSLDVAVKKKECSSEGRKPKRYFACNVTLSDEEKSTYVHAVVRKHATITRKKLSQVTGLDIRTVDKILLRLKNLGKITTVTGYGARALTEYKVPSHPGNRKPATALTPFEKLLLECTK